MVKLSDQIHPIYTKLTSGLFSIQKQSYSQAETVCIFLSLSLSYRVLCKCMLWFSRPQQKTQPLRTSCRVWHRRPFFLQPSHLRTMCKSVSRAAATCLSANRQAVTTVLNWSNLLQNQTLPQKWTESVQVSLIHLSNLFCFVFCWFGCSHTMSCAVARW